VPSGKSREPSANEAVLSPAEAAREIGVDERTVRRWAAAEVIPVRHTVAGHHLVMASTVRALQELSRSGVPLNTRTLRGRFSQKSHTEEVRSQPKTS
jgi:hypothetical protein